MYIHNNDNNNNNNINNDNDNNNDSNNNDGWPYHPVPAGDARGRLRLDWLKIHQIT